LQNELQDKVPAITLVIRDYGAPGHPPRRSANQGLHGSPLRAPEK
jgi:hypothetical protein